MHIAFVKNAENDVDHDDRRQNQQRLARQGRAEFRRSTGEVCRDGVRQPDLLLRFFDCGNCVTECTTTPQIERNRRSWELSLMRKGKRRIADMHSGKRTQWYGLTGARFDINLVEQIG